MIASSAFFVLDAILDWPVTNYDGSWSQWGQMSGDASNKGTLDINSPWKTDIPSRTEALTYNYVNAAPTMGSITFTGTGTNDLTFSGTFTGQIDRRFRVQIDSAAETFRWSKDGGTTWDSSTLSIVAGSPNLLTDGISATFASAVGHILNDRWDFSGPTNIKAIEKLTFDGSVCAARFSLDGTEPVGPAGCTPGVPDSFSLSANQIEEEDAAYFGAGGAGGGGGGGAPITPGY